MAHKTSTAFYRHRLREAWHLTWKRKSLWIFGIFAALLSTGGVLDVYLLSLRRIQRSGQFLNDVLDNTFIGYALFAEYLQQLQLLGTARISLMLIAFTLIGIGLLCASVISQGAIIHGLRGRKPKSAHHLRRHALNGFFRVLSINMLNLFAMSLLTLLIILPLFAFVLQPIVSHGIILFILLLLFLPITLFIQTLAILSVIDVIDHDRPLLDAIETGFRIMKQQWLATAEYAIILFLIASLALLFFTFVLSLLFIPYGWLYTATLLSGNVSLFLFANVASGLATLLIILLFTGAIVTFQYAAWYRFYKRSKHPIHGLKTFSKLLRWRT